MVTVNKDSNVDRISQIAVITADFVASSRLSTAERKCIFDVLEQESKDIAVSDFDIYRGDSFQGVIYDVDNALVKALRLKTAVNKLSFDQQSSSNAKKIIADFRIAIGVGSFTFKGSSIGTSDGTAFQYSGKQLDGMKATDRNIALITADQNSNDEFEVSLRFLDLIMNKWSTASAEVVYYLLQGYKEVAIAKTLGISQAAVNFRKKVAGWDAIVLLLKRYQQITQKLV